MLLEKAKQQCAPSNLTKEESSEHFSIANNRTCIKKKKTLAINYLLQIYIYKKIIYNSNGTFN